jgi:hypothetical protein
MFHLQYVKYAFLFVMLLACATFYYKAAEMERLSGFVWAGPSVLVFLLTWFWLSGGLFGCLAGQIALFGVITLVRLLGSKRK